MKAAIVSMIVLYQRWFSPDQGYFSTRRTYCVFEPSCSEYTRQALLHGGIFYGLVKGLIRLVSCHPFQKRFFDPFIPRGGKTPLRR